MENEAIKRWVALVARKLLAVVAGSLAAKGWLAADEQSVFVEYTLAAALGGAAIGWSYLRDRHKNKTTEKLIEVAVASPSGTSIEAVKNAAGVKALGILLLCAGVASAQDLPGTRYKDQVFSAADKRANIQFSSTVGPGGVPLRMDCFLPHGDTATNRAWMGVFNGGSCKIGTKDDPGMQAWADDYARRGYVTCVIDYRKDPTGNPCTDGYSDAGAAFRFIRSKAGAWNLDPKLGICSGFSAGGRICFALAYNYEMFGGSSDTNRDNPGFDSRAYGVSAVGPMSPLASSSWMTASDPPLSLHNGALDNPELNDAVETRATSLGIVNEHWDDYPAGHNLFVEGYRRELTRRSAAFFHKNVVVPTPTPSPTPPPSVPTLYVDGTLPSASCTTYSVAKRACGSGSEQAFRDPQSAADAVVPGSVSVVQARAGVYQQPVGSRDRYVELRKVGAPTQPLVFEAYSPELVIFRGRGADKPSANDRSQLLTIGEGWIVRNIIVEESSYHNIVVQGDHSKVENVVARHSWQLGIAIAGSDNVINAEAHNARHASGFGIGVVAGSSSRNTIEESLSHDNGRDADGKKVPPVAGDPDGGGNSDGFVIGRNCCPTCCSANVWQDNIAWNNTDDGADSAGRWQRNTIYFNNGSIKTSDGSIIGGLGLKRFPVAKASTIGVVAFNNLLRAIEERPTGLSEVYHNTAVGTGQKGKLSISAQTGGAAVAWSNLAPIFSFLPAGVIDKKANSTAVSELMNPNFTPDTNFPTGLTVRQKARWLRTQFEKALSPKPGSSLIDAAPFIPGLHCVTADDSPTPPSPDADCRHWRGANPDIGAFEAN